MSKLGGMLEKHQVVLYLVAILCAATVGLAVPESRTALEQVVRPALALLLYITFLGVPVAQIGDGLRDWRFLGAVIGVNFIVVPMVAFAVSRIVADDQALLVGALLVLLTPCIDYVIVFARLAGGSAEKLLALTPVLLVLQMALLPVYLGVMVGPELLTAVDPRPFISAFVLLLLLPFGAAMLTQALGRTRVGVGVQAFGHVAMVPCMMVVLFAVVASQIAGIGSRGVVLVALVPVFSLFVLAMVAVGALVGGIARLPDPERRALIFSGVTRNSLVVLPLALALPAHLDLAPLAVVTQTLIELVAMVALVRLVPVIATTVSQRAS